jgi:hypothetical protein
MTPEERSIAAKRAARARWSVERPDRLTQRQQAALVAGQQEMAQTRLIRESLLESSRVESAIVEYRQVLARARQLVDVARNLREVARIGSEVSG